MQRAAWLIALVCGCSSGHGAAPPPAEPEAPPELCDGEACVAPAECITVVGMQPDSATKQCWITCGDGGGCPAGMNCVMIYDGPGQVCLKPD